MGRGKFISFEGSEGCGKSTQIRLFVEFLKKKGMSVLLTREPGGTAVGEKVRELLQFTPEAANMVPEAELLLFAASRAQLVREVIEPTLAAGAWVVADRFLDSTTVYQGVARGLDLSSVAAVNRLAVGATVPDLTLLLDLDAATGHGRAVASRDAEGDRIEDQPLEFFEKVRSGYLSIAREEERFAVVDASGEIDEIAAAIRGIAESRFSMELSVK